MWRDFVLAFRVLKKSPIATAVTILALALGIGANVGTFTAVNAILLHPFPYPNLDKIITIRGTLPKDGLNRAGITAADFDDWRQRNRSFELLSAYEPWTVNITDGDRPEPLPGARVGAGFFQVFGMKPSIGRTFTESENESGSNRVVVLSDELWRTRFAATPDITGRTVSLGGQKYTVVGVMPNDFDYPLAAEVWVPLVLTPAEKADRLAHNFLAVGMLKAGVNAIQADAEIRSIAAALEQDYPKTNKGWSAAAAPFRQMAESVTNRFIEVLSIASLFLLLLAGANVANIQLAQAMNRQKTIVIEASLGASSFRIARSLCAQSLLLALCGGAAALIAATWMNDANRNSIPARIYQIVPGLRQLRIDSTVILYTLALSLLTGVLCSLPAIAHLLRRSSLVLTETLREGSRSVAGDSRHRMRDMLVIGEIAMALLLLVGAGVMVNTFQHMLLLNLGFNPSKLLTAQISLAKQTYPTDAQITGFFDRLVGELSTIPNVQSASLEMSAGAAVNFRFEDRPDPVARDPKPDIRMVDASYFRTMEMPVIAGRAIMEQDTASSTPVIVISKSVAEHYWPGSDPIGHRVRFGESPWLTIVGICGDTIQWFTNEPEPAAYTSYRQKPMLYGQVLLRTTGDPTLAESAVLAKVRAVDPTEPVYQMKSMEQFYLEERSGVQSAARMMENNAAIALFLALTGIYGVIAYFVTHRTREIGIRIAVGAATSDIVKMTLGEACRVGGIGLAIGVPATYLLMRVLSSALYNIVVVKWSTLSAATVLLAATALLAAYIPARRAAAVDPVIALQR
jgi:putative ABC transport system permease protein